MKYRFEATLAWRHLRAGGWQTVLIITGVSMAVTLVIFISGLIYGLQRNIVNTILGAASHVTVQEPEPVLRVPERLPAGDSATVIAQTRKRGQQRKNIEQWRVLERELSQIPHVRAVSPEVTGQGILVYAGSEAGVSVFGVIPSEREQIAHISDYLIQGTFLDLELGEAVIDYDLSQDLGISIGDRIRLIASTGQSETFRVAGIFFAEQGLGGGGTVYLNLRAAQPLFNTGTAITAFALSLDDVFTANQVADQVESAFALEATSWMREIPQILVAFRAQSATAVLIAAFSLIASGFGIASVLIVSVLKRSREIGILKAMGARSRQVLIVFTLEGLGIAVIGSLVGALGGMALVLAARAIPQPPNYPGQAPEPLLPGVIEPRIVLATIVAAILITIIASVLPARQAARLDPVEVIQRG